MVHTSEPVTDGLSMYEPSSSVVKLSLLVSETGEEVVHSGVVQRQRGSVVDAPQCEHELSSELL